MTKTYNNNPKKTVEVTIMVISVCFKMTVFSFIDSACQLSSMLAI